MIGHAASNRGTKPTNMAEIQLGQLSKLCQIRRGLFWQLATGYATMKHDTSLISFLKLSINTCLSPLSTNKLLLVPVAMATGYQGTGGSLTQSDVSLYLFDRRTLALRYHHFPHL